ncbi:MAG TPA: peptidoglycan-binding protein [Steroidobacteraceae bacterium]|nr:peptidoglycan-binding protein [Steroidobacteraceae bacterium]
MKALSSIAQALFVAGALAAGAAYAHDEAKNPSGQVYASPSQVRLVQDKLREQGRKPGTTGLWDEATIAEVRDYQKANGLAPTGEFDTSLLSSLKVGDVLAGETSATFLDGLLRAEPSKSPPAGRGAAIFVSPVHVAQIQHLLQEQGLYKGAIDGAWGEQTAHAANEFRQKHGLEASPGLDIAMLRALNEQRSPVPKLVAAATLRRDGVPLYAGPTAIRALQRELSRDGRDVGAVDGVWGENTRQALRSYQTAHSLEPTGTLTLPTLAALGIDIANENNKLSSD